MNKKKVYYLRGRALGSRFVDDVDRAEGIDEARYLLAEYRLAFGPKYTIWLTDSHGKKIEGE